MFTDMVGYTALGQRNESLSLALAEEQKRMLRPIFLRHDGREVKSMGDGFLVEFPSALGALRCAFDIQRTAREFNFSQHEDRRVHLRIGIHLGDVVESQGDISGDAVNVASRIEHLAEVGGVCITRQVYDQVQNKFELPLESLGEKALKNVGAPVGVFKVVMPWEETAAIREPKLEPTSVAVLPFANMSPDPNDVYFADGITEEIISTLSNVSGLSVISRTSTMGYKGTAKKVKEIGRELQVGSVLEGSFRKAGNKIRITTQLIDASEDRHLWAHSYDRELDDVFAVQSDIARQITDALRIRILPAERKRLEKAPTTSTEAYALYLKGKSYVNQRNEGGMRKSIEYYEEAIQNDTNYALAYIAIADAYCLLIDYEYVKMSDVLPRVESNLARAIELDEDLAETHEGLAFMKLMTWEWSTAEKEFRKAIELNPSFATAHHRYSNLLALLGRLDESLVEIEKAYQLDPLSLIIMTNMGEKFMLKRDYDQAIVIYKKVLSIDPNFLPAVALLGAVYIYSSRIDEMKAYLPEKDHLFRDLPSARGAYAWVYARIGREADARKALKEAESLRDTTYVSPIDIAAAHLYLGEADEAFRWLEIAYSERSSSLPNIGVNPQFDPIRSDVRFQTLLVKVGLA